MSAKDLKDSPVNDPQFMLLVTDMERCSSSRGGCEVCPLYEDCLTAFDRLSEKKDHNLLKPEEYQAFRTKFLNLKKQLALI